MKQTSDWENRLWRGNVTHVSSQLTTLAARHASHVSRPQATSRSFACSFSSVLEYPWAERETARSLRSLNLSDTDHANKECFSKMIFIHEIIHEN